MFNIINYETQISKYINMQRLVMQFWMIYFETMIYT